MHPWQMTLRLHGRRDLPRAGDRRRRCSCSRWLLVGVPGRAALRARAAVALGLVLFASLGLVVGIYAETWDHTTFITNIVILPLAFVGGVFYSVDILPSPWQELSHFNPLFYLVKAVRYGFLGDERREHLALARRDRGARRSRPTCGRSGCSQPASA